MIAAANPLQLRCKVLQTAKLGCCNWCCNLLQTRCKPAAHRCKWRKSAIAAQSAANPLQLRCKPAAKRCQLKERTKEKARTRPLVRARARSTYRANYFMDREQLKEKAA